MAGMYAVYHGPHGLKAIAERIHKLAKLTDLALQRLGYNQLNKIILILYLSNFDDKTKDRAIAIRKWR